MIPEIWSTGWGGENPLSTKKSRKVMGVDTLTKQSCHRLNVYTISFFDQFHLRPAPENSILLRVTQAHTD